jgi:hypothetical protein
MFAIDHPATALIIKKVYPDVPMALILVSVQLIEILWVALNFLGVEKTRTESRVESVSDVHLEYMPFSQGSITKNRVPCSGRSKIEEENLGP